jgi:hypothetical protein
LTRLERGALAIAEHKRNYAACLKGHGNCDRSQPTPFEAGAIPARAAHNSSLGVPRLSERLLLAKQCERY